MDFLNGYKTYIVSAIGVLISLATWSGFLPEGVTADPGTLFMTSIMFFFTRLGIAKAAAA